MKTIHSIPFLLAVVLFAGCAAIDRNERATLAQHCVPPVLCDKMLHGDVLTLPDIIELSHRQVPPDLIVRYVRSTRAIYNLDKKAIARLNQEKVCPEVIDYLLQTPGLFAPRYCPGPYYPYYPYDGCYYPPYYAYPYPYPVVYGSSVFVVGRYHRW